MDKQERFSIRKLTVGAVSVTIGFWLAGSGNIAHADTVDGNVNQTEVKTDNISVDKTAVQSTNANTEQDVKNQTNNSDVVKSTDTEFAKSGQEKDQTQTDVVNNSTQAGITDSAINSTSSVDTANVAKSSSVSKDTLNQKSVVANNKTNLVNDTLSSSTQTSKQLDNTSVKTNVSNQVTTDNHYVGGQHIKIDDAFKDAFPKSFTVDDSLKYKDIAETQFKNNTYQSDPVAKAETVDVYNLTDSQLTRINKYTTDIINNLRHQVGIDRDEDYKINTDLMNWQQNQTKKQADLNMWGHNAEYLHGAGENVGALLIDNSIGRPISELKPSDFNFTYDPNAKTITTWSPAIAVKTMDDLYAFSYYMTSILMFEDYGGEANSHAENFTFTNRGPKQYSELGIYPATNPKTKKTNLFFRWIVPTIDTFNAANVDNTKNNISANPDKVNKQVIHLIDDTDSSNKLNDVVISNQANTILNASISVPTNYVLAENNTLPSTFDFTNGDLPDLTVHVKHNIETVNDTRNNATETIKIHYVDNKGNKLKDDTTVKFTFHRDYTIDKATGKSTIGAWEYVPNSMTQSGTYIKDIGEPGKHYNSVNGYDSFNFWIPFNVSIPGYSQKYSGLTASFSIPNGPEYLYDGNVNVDQNIVYEYARKEYFTINIYDDDLGTNGKPIGVVGTVNPTSSEGYATVAYKWPNNAKASLADYIISQIPDLPDKVTIAGDFWKTLKVGDDATSLSYPNWRIADFDTVRGKTFTIHIKSAYSSVMYNFIDAATNKIVGTYDLGKVKAGTDVTIDKDRFKRAMPDHYYLDRNYDIPENIVASEPTMTINVPVHKAYVYTIKFYDDTENEQSGRFYDEQSGSYDGISWDGITDKRLTGTIADLQALIDSHVEKLTHDSNAYRQKLDVAKTPAVATVTGYDLKDDDTGNVTSGSAVPVVADLPHTDSTITIHFVHNFLDFTGKAPLYTASSIMLKDVNSANKLANVLNKQFAEYSGLVNITIDDLRDALNGAKWTSGGTIVKNNEYGTIFQADGNEPNIFFPTDAWRVNINNTTKVLPDAFWTDKIENMNNGNHDGTILGNPYLVPIKVHVDLFNPEFEHFRVSNSTVHADLSEPLALKTADTLKPGYHYEVLVGNKTGYEYIPVNSTVLQTASTIPDQINMLANLMGTKTLSTNSDLTDVDVSSIVETSMTTPMSLKLVQTDTGNYEYQLENPAFGLLDQQNFASMDINGLVPYLSPMYKEALKNVVKQSGMSDVEVVAGNYVPPAIMLYVAVPNDETATIKYIDDDTNTVLKTDTVNGKTDKLIEFNDDPSIVINDFEKQGYKVVSNTYKSGIHFGTTNDFEVHLTKKIDNTINYVDNDGKIVKTDKVTGLPGSNIELDIPDGYHIGGQVPSLTINSKTPVQTVNVITNKHETGTPETNDKDVLNIINYVNEDGKTVKTDKVTGKDGDKIKIVIPDGYHIDGQVPSLTINSKTPVQTVNVVTNKHETGTPETNDKDVLNIINYVNEDGKTVKTDKITGKDGDNIKIVIPDGYHIDGQVPSLTINSKTPVQTVNVITNKHETGTPETNDKDVLNIINYVNEDGKTVKTDKITGKDGDNIKIVIPDGYHIDGQVPSLTINSKTPVQTVNVITNKHETGTPETNDKDVLNIVNYVNENGKTVKTDKITGKDGDNIKIVIPDGYHIDGQVPSLTINSKTPVQTVNVITNKHETGTPETNDKDVLNIINYVNEDGKTVKTDKVTGKDGDKIKIVIPDGYHIDGQIPSLTINSKTPVQTVNVVTNKHETGTPETNDKDVLNIINYVNEDGKTVKTDKITGKDGDNIKIVIPDGYHIDGQVPSLTINSKTPVQTVNVITNKHETGTPETNDKDVLNIVNYVNENGKTVKTDKITGKDGDNIKIVIPDGYHIDGQVPSLTINSKTPVQTVNVITNKHETGTPETNDKDVLNIVNYVNENGETVKTDKITGKDGDNIKIVIPDGYHIDGNMPNLTVNSKTPVQTVNIVKDKHETGIPETNDKDVLNIVNYVNENGETVKTDKITGKDGDSIKIVIPDGYHIDGNMPNLTVNSKTPVQTVNVAQDKHETGIPETNDKDVLNIVNYVNENGETVKTDKITGKDGDSIKIVIPDGYHIDGNMPNLTVNSKTPVQTVNVAQDKHETGIPETNDKDVLNIVNYVNENGETVKTDKITGKDGDSIKIVIPDGYHIDGNMPNLTVNSKTPVQTVNVAQDKHETGIPETNDKDVLNIVNYVNENGETVKTDKITGKDGDSIKIVIPDGYHIDGNMPNLTVNSKTPVQTVNIVKDKHETVNPLVDEKPTLIFDEFTKHETNQSLVNGEPGFVPIQTRQMKIHAQVRKLVQHDVSDIKKSTENHARKLPQAGAKQSLVPIILGAISTVLATLGLTRRKKNK